ncbi:MAG TPA: trypsin-like peptidase domain-containing protein [Chthoniobacteraceae bacterium]|nr:trypsin-like peptidase domain-containing protein [Chthoniobacteraceae bacterium]
MKKLRVVSMAAVCAVLGFAGGARADDTATVNLLCSAPWEQSFLPQTAASNSEMTLRVPETNQQPTPRPALIRTNTPTPTAAPARRPGPVIENKFARVRVFNPDGTFTTLGMPNDSGKWAIAGGTLTMTTPTRMDAFPLPLDPAGMDGRDSLGRPTRMVQMPVPPKDASPESVQKAAALVASQQGAYVVVQGKEGACRGFVAASGSGNVLLTKASFIVDYPGVTFQSLNHAAVTTGSISVAIGRDLMEFTMPKPSAQVATLMQDEDKNVAPGDDVMVLGNKDGEATLSPLIGQVLKVEPDQLEVNAPFGADDEGGPVFDLKTGNVIGMAHFVIVDHDEKTGTKYTQHPFERHFAVRTDGLQWQSVDWRSFSAQAAAMKEVKAFTTDLTEVLRALELGTQLPAPTSTTMKNNLRQFQQETSVGTPSTPEQKQTLRFLMQSLKAAAQADVTALKPQLTYDFFQRELAEQQKMRDDLAPEFGKLAAKLE